MTSSNQTQPSSPGGKAAHQDQQRDYQRWRGPLQDYLRQHIPLSRAMALEITRCGHDELVLTAPLAPNINDKGTAFGGAIASLLTLAGWSVVWVLSRHAGLSLDIVIRQSHLRYLRPAEGPLLVRCPCPDAADWQRFHTRLQQRGRARITLEPALESAGHLASTMVAEYAGLANPAAAPADVPPAHAATSAGTPPGNRLAGTESTDTES